MEKCSQYSKRKNQTINRKLNYADSFFVRHLYKQKDFTKFLSHSFNNYLFDTYYVLDTINGGYFWTVRLWELSVSENVFFGHFCMF